MNCYCAHLLGPTLIECPRSLGTLIGGPLELGWWLPDSYIGWIGVPPTGVKTLVSLPLPRALPISSRWISLLRTLWPLPTTAYVLARVALISPNILLLTILVAWLEHPCGRRLLTMAARLLLEFYPTVLSPLEKLHLTITAWVTSAVPLTLPEVLAAGLRKMTLLVA